MKILDKSINSDNIWCYTCKSPSKMVCVLPHIRDLASAICTICRTEYVRNKVGWILAKEQSINHSSQLDRKRSRHNQRRRLKEGIGVYVVHYNDELYVGSGQLVGRRNSHLSGTGRGMLNTEKATIVDVLCSNLTTREARSLELAVIAYLLDKNISILNKNNPHNVHYALMDPPAIFI